MASQDQDKTHVVEEAQRVLDDLKEKARQANEDKDLFMLRLYDELLRVASPVVVKAFARMEREEKASVAKQKRALSKAEYERKKAEREARKGTTP